LAMAVAELMENASGLLMSGDGLIEPTDLA
jgi:hypothetical protein